MSDFAELIDENARRQFESDWKTNSLKDIESYLPNRDDSKYWPTLEELLYIDLEFSWKEYEQLPSEDTISIHQSPTERFKTISRRLNLEQKKDLLDRLHDFEQSLREKSKNRREKINRSSNQTAPKPADSHFEIETLARSRFDTSPIEGTSVSPELESKQQFGDYVLLEMLGRGGMGVVFRALEKKTGRQVALKMIRSNIVNRVDEETQRIVIERFQTEAKAVANIDHPNIVTLFDVDQHDDTPFISMQLVNGEDFASHIRQSVFEGKIAARYLKTIAEAISAAHEKGIIHRDLKPHNILLNDDNDQPLVTDFGLAKLIDDKEGVTETGELLGTPGYMSPEQASGKPVDHSTDIYSLGATLYCLIGGRAPFQAADTMKTIEQIVKNPPVEPKEVNPDVDSDLNTICLKCLEKDPSRRYETAKQLAEDLDRYIKGEPIKARPIGTVEKSIRWCRRNPLPTTIVIAMLLLTSVALVGYFLSDFYYRQNQKNAALAYEANKKELFLVTEDESLKLPGMGDTRESLLVPLRKFFQDFIEINGQFEEADEQYAFAHFALGKIAFEMGDTDQALEQLGKAIELQQALVLGDLKKESLLMDLSNSLNLRGECLVKLDIREKALIDFESAQDLRQRLVDAEPDNFEYLRKLANTVMNVGNWFAYAGGEESEKKALEYYASSTETRDAVLESEDLEKVLLFRTMYDKAKCLYNASLSHANLESKEKALQNAKTAMAILADLHKQKPNNIFVARDKARCAELLLELGSSKDKNFYRSEIGAAYRHIVRLYPEEKQYFWMAARTFVAVGESAIQEGDFVVAKESLLTALSYVENERRSNNDDRITLFNICLGLVTVYLQSSENEEVKSKIDLARTLLNELKEADVKDLDVYQSSFEALEKIVVGLLGPDL